MNITPRNRALVAITGVVLALGIGVGTAWVVAADGDTDEPAVPVEPDGGIGDTPIPVEPDGGIGDTPGDQFPVEQVRNDAHGLLGRYEADVPAEVRIGRKGDEQFMLTEDYVLGRSTVELDDDGDGYRVTSVTVELPDGPETFHLTPG
jgi:hypothetical protein